MAQPTFRQYDPSLVTVSFKGVDVRGFMTGTFVEAERAEDAYKVESGAQGDVVRTRNRNRIGSITVTLMQASPSNATLSFYASKDERDNTGRGAIQVQDLNGQTIARAADAWVRKKPKMERGTDLAPVEWVFDCAQLELDLDGSTS